MNLLTLWWKFIFAVEVFLAFFIVSMIIREMSGWLKHMLFGVRDDRGESLQVSDACGNIQSTTLRKFYIYAACMMLLIAMGNVQKIYVQLNSPAMITAPSSIPPRESEQE